MTIENVRAIKTPQKSYQWEVEVQGLSTGGLQDMKLYAKTVSIPQSAVEQTRIAHKSSNVYFAGRDSSSHTASITFWDDENQTVRNFFQNWMDLLIYNPATGGQAPKNLYAATLLIRLMDSTGEVTTARVRLENAFPTDIADVSLSYDSSEPVEINITMSFDTKIIENL